jgi:hypothetical protein
MRAPPAVGAPDKMHRARHRQVSRRAAPRERHRPWAQAQPAPPPAGRTSSVTRAPPAVGARSTARADLGPSGQAPPRRVPPAMGLGSIARVTTDRPREAPASVCTTVPGTRKQLCIWEDVSALGGVSMS